jgi:hypothetical protein
MLLEQFLNLKEGLIGPGYQFAVKALFLRFLFIIIIISQLMFSLLGLRPSLWIKHKESEPTAPSAIQCGLVDANQWPRPGSRDQRLNVPSEARQELR